MFTKIKNEFFDNRPYFYRVLFIILLTLIPQFLFAQSNKYAVTIFFISLFLLLVSKTSKVIFSLFITYLLVLNIFQANVAFHWGGQTEDLSPRVEVAMISPSYETTEYLQEFVDYRDYLMLFYTLIVFGLLIRFVLYYKHHYKVLKKFALYSAILIFLVLQNQQPFKLIKNFVSISERSEVTSERTAFLQNYQPKHSKKKSLLYDKIIVIQGEAANKNFMGVYGYDINTTPYLSQLVQEKNATLFNAIAPSNQTRFSVPMIFTKADVAHWYQNYTHSASILTDLSAQGYETHWVSNQAQMGEHEDYITHVAMEADTTTFLHQLYAKFNTDGVIKKYLSQHKSSHGPEMYVFHLMGSHVGYSARYEKKNALYPNPKDVVQQYLNTIFFTDEIIRSIVEHFDVDGAKVLVIYLSDHGEVVTNEKHGHGYLPTYADEYDIPLVVYSNIKNSRLDALALENQTKRINAESLNYFITYLAGTSDEHNISYSAQIFSLDPDNIFTYDALHYFKP